MTGKFSWQIYGAFATGAPECGPQAIADLNHALKIVRDCDPVPHVEVHGDTTTIWAQTLNKATAIHIKLSTECGVYFWSQDRCPKILHKTLGMSTD